MRLPTPQAPEQSEVIIAMSLLAARPMIAVGIALSKMEAWAADEVKGLGHPAVSL